MENGKYAEGVPRLLGSGERLLTVAKANFADGISPPDPPRPDVPGEGSSARHVLLNMISPLVVLSVADKVVDLLIYGVAGRGAPGSHASRLNHLWLMKIRESILVEAVLAVTDQRLLVCATGPVKLWSSQEDDDRAIARMEVLWAAPRGAVARAVVGWHRLNPKRLRIDFTDESWLAFTVPLAESGEPLRAVAAALGKTVDIGGPV